MSGDPNLLVGFQTSDDAAVYKLSDDLAIISTVDYITPPVDDPYWFGQIAAANSLSDIYAMGGEPLTALNLVMFPSQKLNIQVLKDILRGGNDKLIEAGASMAGGHSVDDNEPKYGLAVTGRVHPDRMLTNAGAQAGDALILTKPLGTGVLFNANRSGKLPYAELEAILPQVSELNRRAIQSALRYDIHACTDVTGFGLIGHALEIAKASGVQIDIFFHQIPFYANALRMYQKGETTGSNDANRGLAEGFWEQDLELRPSQIELLFDPQTSGGLLLALPQNLAQDCVTDIKADGFHAAAVIGQVIQSTSAAIHIR